MEAKLMQKKWSKMSEDEKQRVFDLYDTGKYKQYEIARMVNRDGATISTMLKEYRKRKSTGTVPSKGGVSNGGDMIRKDVKYSGRQPVNQPSKYPLSKRQQELNADEVAVLKESKNANVFTENYFKKFGFIRTANQLRDIWTLRKAIFDYEVQKHAVKPITGKITEKADEEVGSTPSLEVLVGRTNNRLAECIQLHKDLLKVAKEQLDLFKQIQERAAEKSHKPVSGTCKSDTVTVN
jgi:hypothetical protein